MNIPFVNKQRTGMIFKMIEHSKFYTYLCLFYPDIY